jgi:hypothetical protein
MPSENMGFLNDHFHIRLYFLWICRFILQIKNNRLKQNMRYFVQKSKDWQTENYCDWGGFLKCIEASAQISKQDWMVWDKTKTHISMWFYLVGVWSGEKSGTLFILKTPLWRLYKLDTETGTMHGEYNRSISLWRASRCRAYGDRLAGVVPISAWQICMNLLFSLSYVQVYFLGHHLYIRPSFIIIWDPQSL